MPRDARSFNTNDVAAFALPRGGIDVASCPARNMQRVLSRPRKTSSGITLWQPAIVLPERRPMIVQPGTLTLAAPADGPAAVGARLEAARSALGVLSRARTTLGARAAAAAARAREARSDGERVSATMATYRVEAALQHVLTRTLARVTALMEEPDLT